MKKAVSLIMCILMLTGLLTLFPSAASVCTCTNTPMVYVQGAKTLYRFNEDGTKTELLTEEDGVVTDIAKTLVPEAAKAIATGSWDSWCDAAYEALAPLYDGVEVDGDGQVVDERTRPDYTWSYDTVYSQHDYHMGHVQTYIYDQRLSPMEIADDLHEFIETVKEKTGHDKVVLVSRCMGTNYAMAYLDKYERPNNYSGIESCVFFNGALNGMDFLESVMSGTVKLDADGIYRFAKANRLVENYFEGDIADFLNTTLSMLEETYGLDITCSIGESIYAKIKDKFIARLLKEYYGVSAGYLSCVNEHFDEAIDYIFQEEGDKEYYAGIIAKAKDYHDNVQSENYEILSELKALGIRVGVVAEYGFQMYPLCETANNVGEQELGVVDQSFGATVSRVDGTLSSSYIDGRVQAGFGKYISPDKQIDASTCLFPDTTWFVKNANHTYPECIHVLIVQFIRNHSFTVDTSAAYPQYLNYYEDEDKIVPALEVNDNDIIWSDFETEPGTATTNFITRIYEFIRGFVEELIAKITRLVKAFN